jgi:hypothetical protein
MKDWLSCENARNKKYAALYVAIMKRAFGFEEQGEPKTPEVIVGHHLTFELGGDLETENEIPSADCLMFDHYIMGQVFGDKAIEIMQHLAATPCESRDTVLQEYWETENSEAMMEPVASGYVYQDSDLE